jgi:predicted short-subunit dehydrogenase-like oxidoreductase (DUF2520 family)
LPVPGTKPILAAVHEPPAPLADLRFSLVGPGRVGGSLASWWRQLGARAHLVIGRPGAARSDELACSLGGTPGALTDLDGRDDLLLIAVPDPVLPQVVEALAQQLPGPPARIVLHTSGSASLHALAPLAREACDVGSLHPLKAFPRRLPELTAAAGTVFGIDGTPAALALARRLAEAVGGRIAEIPPAARRTYHLAATFAAGGVVTLLGAAAALAEKAGLEPVVRDGYLELTRGALAQASLRSDPLDALTGPVARGDRGTIEAALGELQALDPASVPFATALGLETLRQLALRGALAPDQARLARELAVLHREAIEPRSSLDPARES